MLYLTCTVISSVDLVYQGVSRAKDWVSVACGTSTLKRIKNSTSKNWNLGIHNKTMTLIFIYNTTYITWLPYMFSFLIMLRLVCDVTYYVIYMMRLWLIVRFFRAKVHMKLNAPDDVLSK